jgi:mono/diheme cytochrome c family protein
MKRLLILFVPLLVAGLVAFWLLTAPATWAALRGDGKLMPTRPGDPTRGERLFYAGGCSSCHAVPGQDDKTKLGGGLALTSGFGTFHVPNISSDPQDGIGGWSEADFIRAMREGLSPDGRHYYPAFPYTSYQRMNPDDLADLFAHLKALPAVRGRAPDHDLAFPFNIRRSVGVWKLLFLDGQIFRPDPGKDAEWNHGAYLVEGPGHCGECHTPRNALGAMRPAMAYSGGPDPEGKGWVPNITPDATGIADWSKGDVAEVLKSGFTPNYDAVGGSMAPVVRNTAHLTDEDRSGMAAFVKSLPAITHKPPPKPAQ